MTFEFGQYIAVTHRLVRIKGPGRERTWEVIRLDKPELAVFLRPVTLSDGKTDYNEDGVWFNPDKTYQGAWICGYNRKPEYALMSTIHGLYEFGVI